MGLNTAKIDDFSGGINLVLDETELDPSEFGPLTRNIRIKRAGQSIESREGVAHLTPSGGTTSVYDTVASSDLTSSTNAYTNGILLRDTANQIFGLFSNRAGDVIHQVLPPGAATAIVTAGSAGEWAFEQAQDNAGTQYAWFLNGAATPQKLQVGTTSPATWGGTPPNGTVCKSWKNMMLVAGVAAQPQRLYYSAINNPESWSVTGFIDIKSVDDEAEPIVGLEVVGENLLVFKKRSVWLVFDPVTFENRRIGVEGLINRGCASKVSDRVFWVSDTGVYSTDGNDIRWESKNIAPLWSYSGGVDAGHATARLTVGIRGCLYLNLTESRHMMAVMDPSIKRKDGQFPWYLYGSITDGVGTVNTVIENITWFDRADDENCYGVGVVLSATTQRPMRMTAGQNWDTGTPAFRGVQPDYHSYWMPIQGTENYERLRRLTFVGHGEIDVDVYTDLDEDTPAFTAGSLVLTSGVNTGPPALATVRPESRSRFHKIRVRVITTGNSADPYWDVASIEMKYRGGKEH